MGPSGSGKSTFLSCVAGLERPTSGRVVLEGTDVTHWDETARTRMRRDRIGFVFQDFSLIPYLTAAENVALPARLAGHKAKPDLVRLALQRVGLDNRAGHLPGALSGGQQQRVAIARALVTQPAVLLADEPTGALDSVTAREVLRLLRVAVDELGQTTVMVTHDPVAASFADTVVFMVDGRVAGRMAAPTADAVAAQVANLDQLIGSPVVAR
jgi:putative ABC transport system ATP-binding protein